MLRAASRVRLGGLGQSARPLMTSARRDDSFKVQDMKEFNDRVKNSKKPVIVDFFATYVDGFHPFSKFFTSQISLST
jgi:thioredoxin 1